MIIVLVNPKDRQERTDVNRVMRKLGKKIAPGVWECPHAPKDARRIAEKLEPLLSPQSHGRIIPVCGNCRNGQWIWGEYEPDVPVAYVYDSEGHNIPRDPWLQSRRRKGSG